MPPPDPNNPNDPNTQPAPGTPPENQPPPPTIAWPSSPPPAQQAQTPPPPQPPPGNWPPPPPPPQENWPPPPPPAQGAWPPPPQTGYNPYAQPGIYTTPVNGRQILTLGILSFFCFGIILGPIAYVQGSKAITAIDQGQADPAQRGMANAGRICGLIGGILSAIAIVVRIAMMANGAGH